MPYLGILACKFGKVLSYFQQPRILQNEKFRAKLKIFNCGTKNVGYSCNFKEIFLSYSKSEI